MTPFRSRLQTKTNNSDGIQGSISNGMPIFSRVAFNKGMLAAKGAVPITKGMTALGIADAVMAQHTRQMGLQMSSRR
ncbi:hypothetical protein G7046_g5697 [Stylonectria norvegica]|nr:hypothetical protein G7046_g5697 [Stylonectria norvegica]